MLRRTLPRIKLQTWHIAQHLPYYSKPKTLLEILSKQ